MHWGTILCACPLRTSCCFQPLSREVQLRAQSRTEADGHTRITRSLRLTSTKMHQATQQSRCARPLALRLPQVLPTQMVGCREVVPGGHATESSSPESQDGDVVTGTGLKLTTSLEPCARVEQHLQSCNTLSESQVRV